MHADHNIPDYTRILAAYNSWANRKLIAVISETGEENSMLEQKSSFNTILKTVLHISDAQEIWLYRLHGESPSGRPGGEFHGNIFDACALLQVSSDKLEQYVAHLDGSALNEVIRYKNIKGDPFESTVFEIISHVVNHGSYHRGQLVTMLRNIGVSDLPATDLIVYYREKQPA